MNFQTTVFTLIAFSASYVTLASDVTPKKLKTGDHYVRVTETKNSQNTFVKFEDCIFNSEVNGCRNLGPRINYSMNDLASQSTIEKWQIGGAVLADIAVIVATIYSGGELGAIFGPVSAGVPTGAIVGAFLGLPAGITISALVNPINPYEQFRQTQALSMDVITDQAVVTGDITKFISRLELVLSKL